MHQDPDFRFKDEFPLLDRALKLMGPFIAAIVVFIVIYVLQSIILTLIPVDRALIAAASLMGSETNVQYAYFIFPGIAAVWTIFRPHGSQASYKTRLQRSNQSNVPFYENPDQPDPDYKPGHKQPAEKEHDPDA